MSSNKASWEQNKPHPQHIDSVRSPSSQQHGGRKSLLERLKTDTPHRNRRRPDDAARVPQYVDVTAAFFARDRRHAPQAKHSASLHHESLRHDPLFPEKKQQRQQQKPRNPPQEPQTAESPLYGELKRNIATEAGLIYKNGSARLNDMYEALKGAVANAGMENDRALATVELHHKAITKPLSETMCEDTVTKGHDMSTSRSECRLGIAVDSFRERIQTLEAEVGQLWYNWEVAELEVQDILASMVGVSDHGPMGQTLPIKDIKESLALEIEGLDEELLSIIEESHETAKVSEKDFGKKINGVMNALLQRYLLGD